MVWDRCYILVTCVVGPLVNSEYYQAWLDYWGAPHHTQSADRGSAGLDRILAVENASVSVYMVHGGTSFGFEAGILLQTILLYQS